jgi:hypothetical protein
MAAVLSPGAAGQVAPRKVAEGRLLVMATPQWFLTPERAAALDGSWFGRMRLHLSAATWEADRPPEGRF